MPASSPSSWLDQVKQRRHQSVRAFVSISLSALPYANVYSFLESLK